MHIYKKLYKITVQFLFVIVLIFFSTLHAKNFEKYNKAGNIADYFSGIVLLNQNQYEESQKYLKKLHGLEKKHTTYSSTPSPKRGKDFRAVRFGFNIHISAHFNLRYFYLKRWR